MPRSKGRRRCQSQLKQRADLPPLQHFVLYRPSAIWVMPTLLGVLESRNIPSREKWRRTFGVRETDLAKGGGLEGRLHIES